ncbi:MAG TPA: AMP-binding protein [Solirubrobacteraceae bacterium]|nr:AMP-binding protein [Solirubrobacteraceae bacterium]
MNVTVASILERSYRQYAGRPAVVCGERRLSYRELGERAHRFAARLRELGLQAGDRVVLLSGNRPEFFEFEHALFCGGFVRVAPSSRLHRREISHIVADCGAKALVVESVWAQAAAQIRSELADPGHVVVLDADGEQRPEGTLSYAQLLDSRASPEEPEPPPAAGDIAALLYTSGTTGAPKGAALTHANYVAMVRNSMTQLPPCDPGDVVLHLAPLSHFSGYVSPVFFAGGAAHVVMPHCEPPEALREIERRRVTGLTVVPAIINRLLPDAEERVADTSSLRLAVYAGSAIAPDRLSRAVRALGPVFVQFYGLSETPMPLTALSQDDHAFEGEPPERLASAGRPCPFVELKVVDPDGDELPAGEVGEIVVRGDVVMAGYWGKPDETAEMIGSDGWAATGDLGRLDEEGYLYVVDRKKDMIVTGGYNVFPSEVENVISTLDAVAEVAVVGAPDERWGEALTAVVAPRPGRSVTRQEVVDVCRRNLADYKKPRTVEIVDEVPKTGSGKIMRRVVRDRYWEGLERKIGG